MGLQRQQQNGVITKEPRKVSINEHPLIVDHVRPRSAPKESRPLRQAQSTSNVNITACNNVNRASLLHISSEKRARKVRFFINNDKFFKGAVIAVSGEKFRTFGKLLEHLTRIMRNQVSIFKLAI